VVRRMRVGVGWQEEADGREAAEEMEKAKDEGKKEDAVAAVAQKASEQ
jgi:hypothetical protein